MNARKVAKMVYIIKATEEQLHGQTMERFIGSIVYYTGGFDEFVKKLGLFVRENNDNMIEIEEYGDGRPVSIGLLYEKPVFITRKGLFRKLRQRGVKVDVTI